MSNRKLSPVDELIGGLDRALRTLTPNTQVQSRESPAKVVSMDDKAELSEEEKKHAAGLMRVNHSGEVCAQALYQGQALTAKLPEVRDEMDMAADEEIDHLAWCEARIRELNGQPSVLNPLWYGMSFGLGAAAGLISDRVSLGFVAATEEQVCQHLKSHLDVLPAKDEKSRAVINQMLIDEEKHAHAAVEAGGVVFPRPVKSIMTLVSKAMTTSSYRM